MSREQLAAGLVVLALAVSAVGVVALPLGDPVAAPTDDASRATQQESIGCDYRQLFDRTAGSVVAVQASGAQGTGFAVEVGESGDGTLTVPNGSDAIDANATYFVTNAHVVDGTSEVTVQFREGEYRNGTVIGRSTYADLAVVSVIDAPGYVAPLPVASDDPQRGRAVAALGNPFGLRQTITHGIVSGLNRSMDTDLGFTIPNVVQTDAPISPGNSGGPLVTCDGTVVGVNTAGIPSAKAENIGFAVSASVVGEVVPELVATGAFDYPFLGVSTQPVTPAVAQANDLDETRGVMVVGTLGDGPADGALNETERFSTVDGTPVPMGGDVILAVDGESIRTGEDLASYLLTETEPGQTVELTVLRDGQRRTVSVTVGERPDPATA